MSLKNIMDKQFKLESETKEERKKRIAAWIAERQKVYDTLYIDILNQFPNTEPAGIHLKTEDRMVDEGTPPPAWTGMAYCRHCGWMPNKEWLEGEVSGCPWCHSPYGRYIDQAKHDAEYWFAWRKKVYGMDHRTAYKALKAVLTRVTKAVQGSVEQSRQEAGI